MARTGMSTYRYETLDRQWHRDVVAEDTGVLAAQAIRSLTGHKSLPGRPTSLKPSRDEPATCCVRRVELRSLLT